MTRNGTMTFFCGKMGAGKSTKAKIISAKRNAVLISEDDWLSSHFPGQINSFADYIKYSAVIKPFVKLHVQSILQTGTGVVMDFPANTVVQRAWFKALCKEISCEHELIYLDISNEQCLSQIAKRRIEQPERAKFDSEEMFTHVSKYFEHPSASEELNIVSE